MRSRADGKDVSRNWGSRPTFFVMKICRFHSQMQFSAERIPDVIEAPAPRNRPWGSTRRSDTDRTSASRVRVFGPIKPRVDISPDDILDAAGVGSRDDVRGWP